jgi:hypothetical protein
MKLFALVEVTQSSSLMLQARMSHVGALHLGACCIMSGKKVLHWLSGVMHQK